MAFDLHFLPGQPAVARRELEQKSGMIRPGLIVLMLSALTAMPIRTERVPEVRSEPGPKAAPPTPAPTVALASLRADLERLLASPGRWSVTVLSLDRGDTLFAHSPDIPLAPASNMKLFTTAAALYYLGPQYRYNTFLLVDGTIENGVLQGDLIIYGTGDPTILGPVRTENAGLGNLCGHPDGTGGPRGARKDRG